MLIKFGNTIFCGSIDTFEFMNGMFMNLKTYYCIKKLAIKRGKMAWNKHQVVEIVHGTAKTSHKSRNSVRNWLHSYICFEHARLYFFLQFRNRTSCPWRTMEGPLGHIHGEICPLYWMIKWLIWLRNWLSHLYSHKHLRIFIRDMFDKNSLSHIFFLSILSFLSNIKFLHPKYSLRSKNMIWI